MPESRRIPTTSPTIDDRRAAMSMMARTRTETPSGTRMVETATVKIIMVVQTELTGRNTDSTSRGLTAAAAANPRATEASPPMAARRPRLGRKGGEKTQRGAHAGAEGENPRLEEGGNARRGRREPEGDRGQPADGRQAGWLTPADRPEMPLHPGAHRPAVGTDGD